MDVIVVDDEYPLRAALRRALALEGYGVTEAASGEEAIELLRDRTWDAMALATRPVSLPISFSRAPCFLWASPWRLRALSWARIAFLRACWALLIDMTGS